MSKIYTAKEYAQAIEEREKICQRIDLKRGPVHPKMRKLKRRKARLESAIAAFAICTGKPAVSKGKPEYSWKRARRFRVTLVKT